MSSSEDACCKVINLKSGYWNDRALSNIYLYLIADRFVKGIVVSRWKQLKGVILPVSSCFGWTSFESVWDQITCIKLLILFQLR